MKLLKGDLGDDLLPSLMHYIYPHHIPQAGSAATILLMNSNELETGTAHQQCGNNNEYVISLADD